MLTAQTLVGIACLIANKGTSEASAIEAQLNEQEKIVIESIIQSGLCLPENLEKLIQETALQIENGDMDIMNVRSMPTDGCF